MKLPPIRFRKEAIVETIVMLLVFLFLYTALSKYAELGRFRIVLYNSPLLNHWVHYIAYGLPALEIAIVLLLIIPRTRLMGLYASMVLLIIFTGYLCYMIAYTPHLPCTCGGVISKMTWKQHIFFNTGFIILSLIGIIQQRKSRKNTGRTDNNQLSFA